MFDFLQHYVAPIVLMVFGLINVFLFGSGFENSIRARIRSVAPADIQKLYFENRQINTILGIVMIVAACFIRNW